MDIHSCNSPEEPVTLMNWKNIFQESLIATLCIYENMFIRDQHRNEKK